ncbi:MAG: peptidylprolyl isomerase [Gammaproteobacteria bacterium]
MNKKLVPLLLAGITLMAGCDKLGKQSGSATLNPPEVTKEDAVAVVNGHYIGKTTLKALEDEVAQRSHGKAFPKEQLVEELVRRELLVQQALEKKLDESADLVERIEMAKRSLLSQAAMQDYLNTHPVTDEELKSEYDKQVGGKGGEEYKARHILVKTEDEAKKLIAELDKGANFEDLAKKHSTGPSGPKGGDLGWFAAGQMVQPFSDAVIALQDNQYTAEPVQTQFGWHVILREGSRPQTVPPLAAVKEQLTPFLQRQKIQTMLENLRKQAKVEILIPVTEEQNISTPPAPDAQPKPTSDNSEPTAE